MGVGVWGGMHVMMEKWIDPNCRTSRFLSMRHSAPLTALGLPINDRKQQAREDWVDGICESGACSPPHDGKR